MHNEVTFEEIKLEELYKDILSDFNRYQYVNNDWYPDKDGGYYLIYQPHAENWDDARKKEIIKELCSTLENDSKLFGAYDSKKLIGLIFYHEHS